MKTIRKVTSGLAFRMICGTIFLLIIFNIFSSVIGYAYFTESLTKEYNDAAFRTAETAVTLVDGDKIDEYLMTSGDSDEYRDRLRRMDILCHKQNVTLIYVIDVDRSDYGRFTCVFNSVHEDSSYSRWEIGYQRDTTNEEYRKVYRDIYENGLEQGTVVRETDLRGKEAHITSLVPVHAKDGTVRAILCVQRPMSELMAVREKYLADVMRATLLLSLFAALFIGLYLRHQFMQPVKKIIAEARRFAEENKTDDRTDLSKISKIQEIKELGLVIGKMESDTITYMDNLTQITAERERIDTELALATRIQANMLPNIFPAFPERKEFDVYASMTPAKEVGGDFYDFFLIDDDHLGLVIADVSGKGVPAALFMMASKILVSNYAMMGGTPAEVLKKVNDTICKKNEDDMFVTVWFGIMTISTGEVIAANAGHEYPIIKRADGRYELWKDKHGFIIGGMEGVTYRDYSFRIDHNEMLVLYTDGFPEATNNNGEMYGTDTMLNALNKAGEETPQKLVETITKEVYKFMDKAPQFDDLTMLVVKRI